MISHFKKLWYLVVYTVCIAITGCGEHPRETPATDAALPGSSRLADLLGDGDRDGYPLVLEPRGFDFPVDHGAHPMYRNEWWYLTGNLDGQGGERFGFELTFFRFALSPAIDADTRSAWRTNQVYIAHFAISDISSGRFHVAQRYSRGAAGLAGSGPDSIVVWLDDWHIEQDADDGRLWQISATDNDMGLELDLTALKPVVLNGNGGLSQKSAQPGNASFYYSIPRLSASGTLRIADQSHNVSGLVWLDREWSSSALSAEQQGWDWFALQLSDGTDLMYYQLRLADGTVDAHSAGTWTDASGRSTALDNDDVTILVTDYWTNSRGDTYPAAWRVEIAQLGFAVDVTSAMADQELVTNVRYWEGAVDVAGKSGDGAVTGRGYVELTGYAEN